MPTLIFPPPQPKQREFLLDRHQFVGYGGARGGGKSFAVRLKAVLLCSEFPGIKVLLIRRTFKELVKNHVHQIEEMLADFIKLKGNARVKHDTEEHVFIFPNGSTLSYGHCEHESDVQQYQGIEYDVIFLEEATQFTEFVFERLKACLRGENPFPKRFYVTCNPGGIGHEWVKRLWIDREFHENENPDDFSFISARVEDNAFNGKHYESMLYSLQEPLRSAWLLGSWDTFVGQMYPQWDMARMAVQRPESLPKHWLYAMSIDYGLDCFAPIWYGVDETGMIYIVRGEEHKNCGVKQAISTIYKTEEVLGLTDTPIMRYAPPDLWNRTGQTGQSVIDMFRAGGLHFLQADNSREAGWVAVRDLLDKDQIRVYEHAAPDLCRCMRLLQYAENQPGDASKEPHSITHSPDSLRYFCIMRRRLPVLTSARRSINHIPGPPRTERRKPPFVIRTKNISARWKV